MSVDDRVSWVEDFVFIDANEPAEVALRQIEEAKKPWIVISRSGGAYLYAFTADELWRWPALRKARETLENWLTLPFEVALDLHEELQSTPAERRDNLPAIDRSWRQGFTAPTIARYVQIDTRRVPIAVGYPRKTLQVRRARPPVASAPPPEPDEGQRAMPPLPGEPEKVTSPLEDEGTTPVRYPSIETDRPLSPGAVITATVDLTFAPAAHTQGGRVELGQQPEDWTELTLSVVLTCPVVDFDGEGRDKIIVRRNAASRAASISGTVRPGAKPGDPAPIIAAFFAGTRFCGSAVRTFVIAREGDTPAPPPGADGPPTRGLVVPQPGAVQPDVTVRVFKDQPDRMSWLIETARFDGLPPKLRETVTLDVDGEIAELFKRFAVLPAGEHVTRIEAFGSELWSHAPAVFRKAYWAIWDRYRRPLTFQFITNEPNLPWELMRPVREDESEIHPPLALQHPVARWLEDYDGYMRNQVPPGGVFTIAPRYASVSLQLPRAQAESQQLVKSFAAHAISGTRADVLRLLETLPPEAPVAVLHFAGHGQFVPGATSESSIKLEDGSLTAGEVKRPEVKLGKACRTLVFFNACDVGASGTLFGEVGGWASAFLSRQFGGFIAPLWSVEDEDAAVVADELLTGIVTQRQPIGEVLRAMRAKHGRTSPTFYSYLYYGDVTASLAP